MRLKFSQYTRPSSPGRFTADNLDKIMERPTLRGHLRWLQFKVPVIFLATGCFSPYPGGSYIFNSVTHVYNFVSHYPFNIISVLQPSPSSLAA